MNDTTRPLIDGAFRPNTSIAVGFGAADSLFLIVARDDTSVLQVAPETLPDCEGQPTGWMP